MLVENKHLVWLDYTGLLNLINPYINNPGYWKFCIEYIVTRSASPLDRYEVTKDPLLVNIKNDILKEI